MKRVIFLLLVLCLLLCACSSGNIENTEPSNTIAPAQTEAPAATEAPVQTEAPATEAPAATEAEASKLDLANSCVDKSVEDLFALIGEPASSEYAPSCLGEGEDGCLYYDGFTVYTYKDANGETVTFVE